MNKDAFFAHEDVSFLKKDVSFVPKEASFMNKDASCAQKDSSLSPEEAGRGRSYAACYEKGGCCAGRFLMQAASSCGFTPLDRRT